MSNSYNGNDASVRNGSIIAELNIDIFVDNRVGQGAKGGKSMQFTDGFEKGSVVAEKMFENSSPPPPPTPINVQKNFGGSGINYYVESISTTYTQEQDTFVVVENVRPLPLKR